MQAVPPPSEPPQPQPCHIDALCDPLGGPDADLSTLGGVTELVMTTTDRGGNEGKGRRRQTHAHGQAVGEQTDLLAVGQYSNNSRSRGSVLHDGREEEVEEEEEVV